MLHACGGVPPTGARVLPARWCRGVWEARRCGSERVANARRTGTAQPARAAAKRLQMPSVRIGEGRSLAALPTPARTITGRCGGRNVCGGGSVWQRCGRVGVGAVHKNSMAVWKGRLLQAGGKLPFTVGGGVQHVGGCAAQCVVK